MITRNRSVSAVREDYARIIHSYLAAITDTSQKNYLIAKLFEIPATGALLLVNVEASNFLDHLGFEDGVHYMSYTIDSMEETISFAVLPKNRPIVDRIRRNGHALVHKHHTTSTRAHFIHSLALQHLQAELKT